MNKYINADELTIALKSIRVETKGFFDFNDGVDFACDVIDKLPSADVRENTHGEWLDGDKDRITGICSVCGFESFLYETDVAGMNFCPNCGADMRERE